MPIKLADNSSLPKLQDSNSLTRVGNSAPLTKLGPTFSFGEKLGQFALSTVESFPELFGIEPSDTTQGFRTANPVSGFLSQALGAFVPYVGAAKGLRAIPAVEGAIGGLEALGKGPISRAALGAIGEASAVEAARLGVSATPVPGAIYGAITGDDKGREKPLDLMAGESALNVLGAGVVGAGLGALGARFAKAPKIADLVPEAAPDLPIMQRARALNDVVRRAQDPADAFTLPEDQLARFARERDQLIRFNLQDVVPAATDTGESIRSGKYNIDMGKAFRSLVGDKRDEVAPFLNRAWNWTGRPDRLTTTRRLILDPAQVGGYTTEQELADDLAKIGISREELGLFAQDIRTIGVNPGTGKLKGEAPTLSDEGGLEGERLLTQPQARNTGGPADPAQSRANGLQKRFTNSKVFSDVGDGWRMGKEQDGLYVMVKKIQGDISTPAPGDRWAFLRTDSPEVFAPRAARTNDILMRSAYFPKPEEAEKIGEALFDADSAYAKAFGENILPKKQTKTNAVGSFLRDSAETIGTYAAPSGPLATRNPLFNFGFQRLKNLEALAESRVDRLLHGEREFLMEKSLLGNVATLEAPHTEGLAARIKELTKDDLADIKAVLELEVPFDQVASAGLRGIFSEKTVDFLRAMQLVSDDFAKRVGTLQDSVQTNEGVKLVADFQARKGHYALTRDFPGAYRIFLQSPEGEVVGMATGASPKEASEAAKTIIEEQAKRGKVIHEGGMVDEALRNPEQIQALKSKVLRPGFLKNRGDLLGYDLQRGDLTNSKLLELVSKNLRRRENYIRNVVAHEKLAPVLAQLERTAPQDAIALSKRLRIMNGDEGEFARVQNAIMDKTLHAVGFGGKDTASKIVRETQKLLTDFQFNFGNLTQPILNMVGTLQTVLPEISYLVNASPETLARNYASMPLLDGAGNVKGTLGVLSEWKVFGNAFGYFGKTFKELDPAHQSLIKEMVRERILAPHFAEESYGVNGALLRDPVSAFKEGHSFIDLFRSANNLLISKSEELNRMLALNAAYEVAVMRGMNEAQMVHFTREFLAKTAFNYSTVDRATVFTTPLGSLAGTFKNWMFHYMANMVKFATAGKEGLPALFWQTASTAVIGGSAATPFLVPIADGASKFLTNNTFLQNLYQVTGALGLDERVADGIMYGLPGSMGLSFSSQTASPGADPERDAQMIFSFAAADRVKALSAGVRDALVAYKNTGVSPWENETVRGELVRALAPRTIYRSMQLSQDLAIRSLTTGYDVTQPLGLGSALLYGAGFNPTELEKTYEVYNQIRDNQAAKKELVTSFGEALAQAWETGDDRLANRVYARAMSTGVDMSSVLRSAQARQRRGEETQLEFQSKPEDEDAYGFAFN